MPSPATARGAATRVEHLEVDGSPGWACVVVIAPWTLYVVSGAEPVGSLLCMQRAAAPRQRWARQPSRFREWITADGSTGFRAEPGRYHLYVAAPARGRTARHRARLKGLEDVARHVLRRPDPRRARLGVPRRRATTTSSTASTSCRRPTRPPTRPTTAACACRCCGTRRRAASSTTSPPTSSAMLNDAFDAWAGTRRRPLPEPLRAEIDELNDWIYADVNNGVYRAGFARTPGGLRRGLRRASSPRSTRLEALLGERRYLAGDAHHRGRLAAVADARALRRRLLHALPLQRPADRRLPEPVGLRARALPAARASPRRRRSTEIKRHYYTTHDSLNPRHHPARAAGLGPRAARAAQWVFSVTFRRKARDAGAVRQGRRPEGRPAIFRGVEDAAWR